MRAGYLRGGDQMEGITQLLWHIPAVMVILLAAGLLMGQRQVGELSIFDLLVGITIGAVAGAGIVDLDLPFLPVLLSILGLGLLHFAVTVAKMKWKRVGRLLTFEPTVVVKQGRPLRENMRRVRMTLSDLLPLLRDKEIFDLREVEYGVLEPDGKLTVIKAQAKPKPKGLTRAVIVDGSVEPRVLREIGWDESRLRTELQRLGYPNPKEIYLATVDEAGSLYVVPHSAAREQPVILH